MSHPFHPHGPALPEGPGRAAVRARSRVADARLPLAVGAAALAGVVLLGVSDPYRPGSHPLCPVLALTGLYCAGCGGQRAVHDLAHLDVVGAWGMNPLLVLAAPVAVLAWARWLHRRLRGLPPTGRGASAAHAWTLAAVVVAFAVLRNVPALAPWLAP